MNAQSWTLPSSKKLLQIKNLFYSWPCRGCSRVSARLKGGKCLRNSLPFLQQRWKVAFRSAGKTPPKRLEKRLLTFQQSASGWLPAIWISSYCRKLLRILPRGSAWKGTDLLRKKVVSWRPSYFVLRKKPCPLPSETSPGCLTSSVPTRFLGRCFVFWYPTFIFSNSSSIHFGFFWCSFGVLCFVLVVFLIWSYAQC